MVPCAFEATKVNVACCDAANARLVARASNITLRMIGTPSCGNRYFAAYLYATPSETNVSIAVKVEKNSQKAVDVDLNRSSKILFFEKALDH